MSIGNPRRRFRWACNRDNGNCTYPSPICAGPGWAVKICPGSSTPLSSCAAARFSVPHRVRTTSPAYGNRKIGGTKGEQAKATGSGAATISPFHREAPAFPLEPYRSRLIALSRLVPVRALDTRESERMARRASISLQVSPTRPIAQVEPRPPLNSGLSILHCQQGFDLVGNR